jgi:uracil-DNA glycosylase family 4
VTGGVHDAAGVRAIAGTAGDLAALDSRLVACRACPRLVAWREEVARTPRAAFAGQTYWGRPVPGFGPPDARICVVGLAPAAHGGNRTGRMFTGDRSGDWLYGALYRAGLASQPDSTSADDGLELRGVRITAPVHCAPPANKPTTGERDTCRPWLARELALLAPTLRVIVALGGFGWSVLWSLLSRPDGPAGPAGAAGPAGGSRRPPFAHGAEVALPGPGWHVLASYHVSQQNTFTGRLTKPMLDAVFRRAVELAGAPAPAGGRPP